MKEPFQSFFLCFSVWLFSVTFRLCAACGSVFFANLPWVLGGYCWLSPESSLLPVKKSWALSLFSQESYSHPAWWPSVELVSLYSSFCGGGSKLQYIVAVWVLSKAGANAAHNTVSVPFCQATLPCVHSPLPTFFFFFKKRKGPKRPFPKSRSPDSHPQLILLQGALPSQKSRVLHFSWWNSMCLPLAHSSSLSSSLWMAALSSCVTAEDVPAISCHLKTWWVRILHSPGHWGRC